MRTLVLAIVLAFVALAVSPLAEPAAGFPLLDAPPTNGAHDEGPGPADPTEADTERTDVPAAPIDSVWRVHVFMTPFVWSAKADPEAWAEERVANMNLYYGPDHGVRLVLCHVGTFEPNGAVEWTDYRAELRNQYRPYANRAQLHSSTPLDSVGGDCEGPAATLGQDAAGDLFATFVTTRITCGGTVVGGCAHIGGDFSVTTDYTATWWADAHVSHTLDHLWQHELSHNFGALDNECDYGIMDYDHLFDTHDWCTTDEARMTLGDREPRATTTPWVGVAIDVFNDLT